MQEEIAVGNTTRRLREATGDEFFALNNRLAVVMGLPSLADDRSPAHPRLFARALLDVISGPGPDMAAKLAAFSAHDPALLQALATTYRDANALLASRGVLPNFRSSYGAPQQVPGVHAVSHALPEGTGPQPAATPPPRPPPRQARREPPRRSSTGCSPMPPRPRPW